MDEFEQNLRQEYAQMVEKHGGWGVDRSTEKSSENGMTRFYLLNAYDHLADFNENGFEGNSLFAPNTLWALNQGGLYQHGIMEVTPEKALVLMNSITDNLEQKNVDEYRADIEKVISVGKCAYEATK